MSISPEADDVDPLGPWEWRRQVCAALGLRESGTVDEALAAVAALKEQRGKLADQLEHRQNWWSAEETRIRRLLGLAPAASVEAVHERLGQLVATVQVRPTELKSVAQQDGERVERASSVAEALQLLRYQDNSPTVDDVVMLAEYLAGQDLAVVIAAAQQARQPWRVDVSPDAASWSPEDMETGVRGE